MPPPPFGEGEVVRGDRSYHSREHGGFLWLSIVTTALSLTIRPQFAIEYLWCSLWSRYVTLGVCREQTPQAN